MEFRLVGKKRYRDFNSYLRELYGERVQKITVDAGLTCPNRDGTLGSGGCIYCNVRGSGLGFAKQGRSVSEQIRSHRKYIVKRYKAHKFLVYFQSFSNTYAPLSRLNSLYEEALSSIDGIVGLSIGTRPDCVDEPVLDLLEGYARDYLIWVEYGLQSACDRTLQLIKRGHDFKRFQKTVRSTQGRNIRICSHVILGLPGETRKEMMETAKAVAALGIDGIKLHLLYVVKGTKLDRMYQQGQYQCLEQNEYVDLLCEFLEYLPPEMIIQRLTGDPHEEELAAPRWALDKQGTRDLIEYKLVKKDIVQGKKWNALP